MEVTKLSFPIDVCFVLGVCLTLVAFSPPTVASRYDGLGMLPKKWIEEGRNSRINPGGTGKRAAILSSYLRKLPTDEKMVPMLGYNDVSAEGKFEGPVMTAEELAGQLRDNPRLAKAIVDAWIDTNNDGVITGSEILGRK